MGTGDHEHLTEFVGPFRMTRDDFLALKALAKRSERTLAGEIRLAIRKHLKGEA